VSQLQNFGFNFKGVDRLRLNIAERDTGADSEMDGADETGFLHLNDCLINLITYFNINGNV
jgi:hypothetical protein